MSNIVSLRESLFKTLRGLHENTMDPDRAMAISEVAKVIVSSAQVEVNFLKATGCGEGSGFIPKSADKYTEVTTTGQQKIESIPGGRVISHRMAG
jgi:hypothetical protein